VDSVRPGSVGRGRYDAATLGGAADQDWLAQELRVLKHLNSGVEGVQIQMEDDPMPLRSGSAVAVVFSSLCGRLNFQG
jgi:hypothetical protein